MSRYRIVGPALLAGLLAVLLVGTGCSNNTNKPQAEAPPEQQKTDEVVAVRGKLAPADRALVEAQEWCVVSHDQRLGSMGPPMKLDIKGQPVFICCKGCKRKAEADPDKTLAKVEELKAKAKSEKGAKN